MTTTPNTPLPEQSELLPCPFCGSTTNAPIERVVHLIACEFSCYQGDRYMVQCDNCACSTGYMASEEDAIAAWNTRLQPPPAVAQAGEVERLRATILHDRFPYVERQDENRPVMVHWFDVLMAIDKALAALQPTGGDADDKLGNTLLQRLRARLGPQAV